MFGILWSVFSFSILSVIYIFSPFLCWHHHLSIILLCPSRPLHVLSVHHQRTLSLHAKCDTLFFQTPPLLFLFLCLSTFNSLPAALPLLNVTVFQPFFTLSRSWNSDWTHVMSAKSSSLPCGLRESCAKILFEEDRKDGVGWWRGRIHRCWRSLPDYPPSATLSGS